MLFAEKIRQLREEQQLPQRQLAAALEIDTATYCKIEKGDRKAKRNQVATLAICLCINTEELLNFWLADQVYFILKDEINIEEILRIAQENIRKCKIIEF